MDGTLGRLTKTFAQTGRVEWIGVRPGRREEMAECERVAIDLTGLRGDRRTEPGKRAVSLIQWEHLPVIAALIGAGRIGPKLLRRNIAISGINLLGLRKARFRLGSAILQGTGLCAPCSRMEENLGAGGYSAVRGHGGITAEVLEPGVVARGDELISIDDDD